MLLPPINCPEIVIEIYQFLGILCHVTFGKLSAIPNYTILKMIRLNVLSITYTSIQQFFQYFKSCNSLLKLAFLKRYTYFGYTNRPRLQSNIRCGLEKPMAAFISLSPFAIYFLTTSIFRLLHCSFAWASCTYEVIDFVITRGMKEMDFLGLFDTT